MAGSQPWRVLTVLDYTFVYETARVLFHESPDTPPARGYGHVDPTALGAMAVDVAATGPAALSRQLVGVHVVLPKTRRRAMLRRTGDWQQRGVVVTYSPVIVGTGWRVARSVALTMAVTTALERATCDAVILMSGEHGLLPLIQWYRRPPTGRPMIELATWVSRSGHRVNALAAATPTTPCYALGSDAFARASAQPERAGAPPEAER